MEGKNYVILEMEVKLKVRWEKLINLKYDSFDIKF